MYSSATRILSTALIVNLTGATFAAPPQQTVQVRLGGSAPAAARVRVIASDGQEYGPDNVPLRKAKSGDSYFYADGSFSVLLPEGRARVLVSGGLEHMPQSVQLDVSASSEVTVQMQPWINMASRGWYSGDSHVHLHTGGPIGVTISDAILAARAEGVNYVNLCASNNKGDDLRDADLITGKPHAISTDQHLIVFGEEMRSSIYGHMQFFGINKLVEPQYTGFADTPNSDDFPPNYVMAREAVRQGGIVTYGHPAFAGQPLPFDDDLTADSGAARELPIDAILNVAQAVDVMSYNSDEDQSAELWYRLLNCGLKLAATVGTDALLDQSTDPVGGSRVYVKTKGALTMKSWLNGLAAGRTFVTNGPMVQLTVDGAEPGETVSLTKAGNVRIRAGVESHVPFDTIELIVNGKVVLKKSVSQDQDSTVRVQQFETTVPVADSSWVALRVRGPDHPHVFDGPVWSHTSPVFVIISNRPIRSVDDAKYFVEWIDQLLRVVAARNRYKTPMDREQVEIIFREAREKFRAATIP